MKNIHHSDNYSRGVSFAKAHTLKPLYMRLLKVFIDHPNGLRRHEALNITHSLNLPNVPNYGWLIGPFLLLKKNGFATFNRRGHQCYWRATPAGESFYNVMLIQHDLLSKTSP